LEIGEDIHKYFSFDMLMDLSSLKKLKEEYKSLFLNKRRVKIIKIDNSGKESIVRDVIKNKEFDPIMEVLKFLLYSYKKKNGILMLDEIDNVIIPSSPDNYKDFYNISDKTIFLKNIAYIKQNI
jgi:hypothetical protein